MYKIFNINNSTLSQPISISIDFLKFSKLKYEICQKKYFFVYLVQKSESLSTMHDVCSSRRVESSNHVECNKDVSFGIMDGWFQLYWLCFYLVPVKLSFKSHNLRKLKTKVIVKKCSTKLIFIITYLKRYCRNRQSNFL